MQPRCIPLRDLRNLRENIHMRGLNQYTNKEIPMSPADLADDADKTQNNKTSTTTLPTQPVFLCEIMQLAAFPLRNLRYLRENNTQEDASY